MTVSLLGNPQSPPARPGASGNRAGPQLHPHVTSAPLAVYFCWIICSHVTTQHCDEPNILHMATGKLRRKMRQACPLPTACCPLGSLAPGGEPGRRLSLWPALFPHVFLLLTTCLGCQCPDVGSLTASLTVSHPVLRHVSRLQFRRPSPTCPPHKITQCQPCAWMSPSWGHHLAPLCQITLTTCHMCQFLGPATRAGPPSFPCRRSVVQRRPAACSLSPRPHPLPARPTGWQCRTALGTARLSSPQECWLVYPL